MPYVILLQAVMPPRPVCPRVRCADQVLYCFVSCCDGAHNSIFTVSVLRRGQALGARLMGRQSATDAQREITGMCRGSRQRDVMHAAPATGVAVPATDSLAVPDRTTLCRPRPTSSPAPLVVKVKHLAPTAVVKLLLKARGAQRRICQRLLVFPVTPVYTHTRTDTRTQNHTHSAHVFNNCLHIGTASAAAGASSSATCAVCIPGLCFRRSPLNDVIFAQANTPVRKQRPVPRVQLVILSIAWEVCCDAIHAGYWCGGNTDKQSCIAGTYNTKTNQTSSNACIKCAIGLCFARSCELTTAVQARRVPPWQHLLLRRVLLVVQVRSLRLFAARLTLLLDTGTYTPSAGWSVVCPTCQAGTRLVVWCLTEAVQDITALDRRTRSHAVPGRTTRERT